jgi:outer membrane phospholipase A
MKKVILCAVVAACSLSTYAQVVMGHENSSAPVGDANDQYDMYIPGISGYKPMFFTLGPDPVFNAKFQVSFKYRFVNSNALSEETRFLDKFYIAYSQKSFWDLESDSAPFKDNNYNPELFYLQRDVFQNAFGENVRMDVQTGYEHESNGEDGLKSRSWDRLYFWPSWTFGNPDDYHFVLAPKIWGIIAEGDEFPDHMEDYYGYGELHMRYGKHDSYMFDVMLRKGTESNHGAVRVNASYPMNRLFRHRLNLYAFVQAYYGEGEALFAIERHSSRWQFGVAFFR